MKQPKNNKKIPQLKNLIRKKYTALTLNKKNTN